MICINRPDTDPYLNLATEEYVLKNFTPDVMMLWQSQPSIVTGKHQNAINEINHRFAEENNIPVIRRITGGGTVYHDLNNINYTVIKTGERKDRLINFREFSKPLIAFLDTLGITATFEGKNNLCIGGRKISGNSAHIFKQRVLHHGTLLFNTDLSTLEAAIRPLNLQIEDKAVKSIRSIVTNISDHLKQPLTLAEFKTLLLDFLMGYHEVEDVVHLNEEDRHTIEKLAHEKYRTWEWNFGYSPRYTFHNHTEHLQLTLEVSNGLISHARLHPESDAHALLAENLSNLPYRKTEIMKVLGEQIGDQNKLAGYVSLFGF